MRSWFRILLFLCAAAGFAAEPVWVSVSSADRKLTFNAAEFAALPHNELVAADPHAKAEHHYQGVSLRELLNRLDAPAGKKIRGAALQLAVLVRGTDGYASVFSLTELDELYGNRTVLLAERDETGPFDAHNGPLRLVVAGDQLAARWVRNVVSIELITVGTVVPRPAHP